MATPTSKPKRNRSKPKRITPLRRGRVDRALELRKRGATYRQIADQLGVNIRTAYEDVRDGLAETTLANAEELKTLMLSQQDTLLVEAFKVMREADDYSTVVAAQRQALRVLDQRMRLLQLHESGDTHGQEQAATLLEQLINGD